MRNTLFVLTALSAGLALAVLVRMSRSGTDALEAIVEPELLWDVHAQAFLNEERPWGDYPTPRSDEWTHEERVREIASLGG